MLHRFPRLIAVLLLALVASLPAGPAAIAADGTSHDWIWPTSGTMTQPFGCTGFWAEPRRGDCDHFHSGVDIANERGTPVRAVDDGVIELVGWDPWVYPDPDWMVIVDHGNGLRTMYAHMRAKPVEGIERGARVFKGQLIGLMDMTGRATGPHLHFAVYLNGEPVNPRNYLTGPVPGPAGSAGPPGCYRTPDADGVGAWLGSPIAMIPPEEVVNSCSA